MNCHDLEHVIVDMARGVPLGPGTEGATLVHLEHCAACAGRFERERTLTASLRAVAGAAPDLADPGAMERRLAAQFAARTSQSERRPTLSTRWPWWLATAASVTVVATLIFGWRALQAPPAPTPLTAEPTEFVTWPGAELLPAFESGQLVRTELPASVLPLLGFAPVDAPDGGLVAADVLLGQDGLARAVRIVGNQSMEP